eukprot:scaffold478743_cov39-Prasinocladus_malaysianus.AAC.1
MPGKGCGPGMAACSIVDLAGVPGRRWPTTGPSSELLLTGGVRSSGPETPERARMGVEGEL